MKIEYKCLAATLSFSLMCVASSFPAFAQDYTGDLGAMYIDAGMSGAMMDAAMSPSRNTVDEHAMEIIAQKPAPVTNEAALSFKYSKQRRTQNLAQIVRKASAVDPEGGRRMQQLFASTDVLGAIGTAIAQYGLRTDNVADAYAVYWMSAWEAAHGSKNDFDFSREQVQNVRQQSANALLATHEYRGASDAVKQELAEIYFIQAALIQATSDAAKSDPRIKSGLAASVRKGARASGLDLDAMTLTPNGFVPRNGGRSDASDPAADSTQLAANDEGGGNLALYAVAGTGLLAGVFALGKGLSKKG